MTVFLRAKDAGVVVLHMLFWKPKFSFNIDLGLMNMGAKNIHYLVDNRYLISNGLNQSQQDRPSRISEEKKTMWKSLGLTKKVIFIPQKKIIFQRKTEVILIYVLTVFHVKQSYLINIKWFLSHSLIMQEKLAENAFTRNAIFSNAKKIFCSSFDTI